MAPITTGGDIITTDPAPGMREKAASEASSTESTFNSSSGHSSSHDGDDDEKAVPDLVEQFHDEEEGDNSNSNNKTNINSNDSYNPMLDDSRLSVSSSQDYSSFVGYVLDDHDKVVDADMDVSYSGKELSSGQQRLLIEQQVKIDSQQLEDDVRAKQRGMRHGSTSAAGGSGPPSTRRSSMGHRTSARRASAGHGSRRASVGHGSSRRSSAGHGSSKGHSSNAKQDALAKQRGAQHRDRSSRPLNQMERDLLEKQNIRGHRSSSRARLPQSQQQPGAVAVSGDNSSMVPRTGSGRHMMVKDRSGRGSSSGRPGAVAVSGGSGSRLDEMESSLLNKEHYAHSQRRLDESRKRSGSSRRLNDESYKNSGSLRGPLTSKASGSSRHLAASMGSGSARRLSVAQMEDDMITKERARGNLTPSGSFASSSRRDMKVKDAVASDLSQVAESKYQGYRGHSNRRSSNEGRNSKDRSSSKRSSGSDSDRKPRAKLVEARPVKEEEELPIDAHMAITHVDGMVDLEEQQRNKDRQTETMKQRQLWTYKVLTVFCLCLAAVTVGAYFIVTSGQEETVEVVKTVSSGPQEPTPAPSQAPTPFLINLPSACIDKIVRDPESPQGLAYRWMVNDPNINQYVGEEWRVLQRFALATIYYALDGPNWYLQKGWMDYDTNECDWSFKGGYGLPAMEMRGLVVPQLVSMIVGGAVTGDPFDWSEFVYVADRPTWPPAPICNPKNEMKLLKIHKNNINGALPDEIALLQNLALMDISYNEGLIGTLPTTLGKMKQMKYIMMEETGITGAIPSEMGEMSCMRMLSTSGTRFSPGTTIPTEMANMKELTALLVGFSGVEGTIPSEMGTMAGNLTILDLSSRDYDDDTIVGTIPSEFGLLTNLHVLSCGNCQVEGTLPSELGALHELELISIGPSGDLVGTIPTSFGGMTSLKYAQLSYSQLSGQIPSELGAATDLVRMYLMENKLTGSLPSELGRMTSLQSIRLNGNEGLMGTIPEEVVDGWTESLVALNISDTRLTGEVFLFNESA